jgi:heterogeneous nuclear rnp K-like protein 2
VTIKFMIPNSRMGSVIGKGGSKIKEIQEASGAKLNASENMLPGSTEVGTILYYNERMISLGLQRVLSVSGVADAIHIATYYVGNILIEANERHPTNARETIYRPSSYQQQQQPPPQPRRSGPGPGPSPGPASSYGAPPSYGHSMPYQMPPAPYGAPVAPPGGALQTTQHIYIPNNLVGCIIGKGGSKINEIRHLSASTIKIMEPGSAGDGTVPSAPGNENERLVVITGAAANVTMAVQMLYQVRWCFQSRRCNITDAVISVSNKKRQSKCARRYRAALIP